MESPAISIITLIVLAKDKLFIIRVSAIGKMVDTNEKLKGGPEEMRKKKLALTAITLMGIAVTFGTGISDAVEEENSSSACINCHTDLEEMDSYGAAAASGGAAIAG